MSDSLISIQDVAIQYPSDNDLSTWAIRIERFSIMKNSIYAVRGANMAGKSTLMKFVSGRSPHLISIAVSSKSKVDGLLLEETVSGDKVKRTRIRKKDVVLLLHDDPMFPEMTLWQNVLLARSDGCTVPVKVGRRAFDDLIKSHAIFSGKSSVTRLGQLSSGGKALIRLARAIVWGGSLTLVDEVSAHLDDENAFLFFEWFGKIAGEDKSAMFISHLERDWRLAKELACSTGLNYEEIYVTSVDGSSCIRG